MPKPSKIKTSVLLGLCVGALLGAVFFAPAAWVGREITRVSNGRLILHQPLGSIWQGSALLVFFGGAGSSDARALPGRISWSLGFDWARTALTVVLQAECCILPHDDAALNVQGTQKTAALTHGEAPGVMRIALYPEGRWRFWQWAQAWGWEVDAPNIAVPADWLMGLGAPFNTIKLGGVFRLRIAKLAGRMGIAQKAAANSQGTLHNWELTAGAFRAELYNTESALAPVAPLGNFALVFKAAAMPQAPSEFQLLTLPFTATHQAGAKSLAKNEPPQESPLTLEGTGQLRNGRLGFVGSASVAQGLENSLANFLSVLGQVEMGAASPSYTPAPASASTVSAATPSSPKLRARLAW